MIWSISRILLKNMLIIIITWIAKRFLMSNSNKKRTHIVSPTQAFISFSGHIHPTNTWLHPHRFNSIHPTLQFPQIEFQNSDFYFWNSAQFTSCLLVGWCRFSMEFWNEDRTPRLTLVIHFASAWFGHTSSMRPSWKENRRGFCSSELLKISVPNSGRLLPRASRSLILTLFSWKQHHSSLYMMIRSIEKLPGNRPHSLMKNGPAREFLFNKLERATGLWCKYEKRLKKLG